MPEKFPEKTLDYGSAVRRLRQERGMTSEALAGAAEVSPSYLSEVERGLKRPSTDVLAKLARAFGMLPSQLLQHIEMWTPHQAIVAQSFGSPGSPALPQTRWASNRLTYLPTDSGAPAPKRRAIQTLVAVVQDLDDQDLRIVLDLARHLLNRQSK